MNKEVSNTDCGDRVELHRLRNELYSLTLTLRAVTTLLERGEFERARVAALKALNAIADESVDA